MKYLIVFLLLTIPFFSFTQNNKSTDNPIDIVEFDIENQDIKFVKIIEIPGLTEKQIIDKSEAWLVSFFKQKDSAPAKTENSLSTIITIDMSKSDAVTKVLVGNHESERTFNIDIDSKEGRARIIFSGISDYYNYPSGNIQITTPAFEYYYKKNGKPRVRTKALDEFESVFVDYVKSFTSHLKGKDDNW